jgi:SAM-dependent methyltransferase
MSDRTFGLFRPLRALAKRMGPTSWKRAAWNAEYRRGDHLHLEWSGTPSSVCVLIERYARDGHVLDLGCGDGQVGLGLTPQAYAEYTGVDVSAIAVDEARRRVRALGGVRSQRNSFVAADVGAFVPDKPMDVILFKDSLYYFTRLKLPGVLEHYRRFLKPGGVFIVQMNDLRRHGWIRSLIRERFLVVEDVESVREDFMTLVFR